MEKKLTITIYENPAAAYDIKHWEERFSKFITNKFLFECDIYYFDLPSKNEVVCCIPHNKMCENTIVYLDGIGMFSREKYIFNKLIWIGKISRDQIWPLDDFMKFLETKYIAKH